MDCANALSAGGFARRIDNGARLHLQHGPIDLIVYVDTASPALVDAAYGAAITAFNGLLVSLAGNLTSLRQPGNPDQRFSDPVAQTMNATVCRFNADFVTPMAAVAGSVADFIKEQISKVGSFNKILVNNGGDISLTLRGDSTASIAVCGDAYAGTCSSTIQICANDGIGGIATSGWQGRSHSLGIADAVTVLAETAAAADTAATLIANAVNVEDSMLIQRLPAVDLSPDSDLGERLVTTHVGRLSALQIDKALRAGVAQANDYLLHGHIQACYLELQGVSKSVQTSGLHSSLLAQSDNAPFMDLQPRVASA